MLNDHDTYIFSELRHILMVQLENMMNRDELPKNLDLSRITVEPPRHEIHGDIAINAAMVLAKQAGCNPRDLAEKLIASFNQYSFIIHAEIAGAGFINITLQEDIWRTQIKTILLLGDNYAFDQQIGQGEKINIEYVSANPTGPMHIGHARGAIVGDTLARLLERVGYDVTREYYINDAGKQIDILAQSTLLRIREALGENIGTIPEGLYPADYLIAVGQKIKEKYGVDFLNKKQSEQLNIAKEYAVSTMMEKIKEDLQILGIKHDVFISEAELHKKGEVSHMLKRLDDMGLVYEGILAPPKDKKHSPDWISKPQMLFKATQFGDDTDRALQKSDGNWTYFAPDIAYHFNKYNRGFYKMINIWGADHTGYITRMKSAVSAITRQQANLEIKICQLVKLMRGKEVVKMSKRSGQFITLREVVDEVGKNAIRFMMLTRKNDIVLEFDFNLVKEKSRNNPIFYVQYAHARICSVFRNARKSGFDEESLKDQNLSHIDTQFLKHPAELSLLKTIAIFPRIIEQATQKYETHHIAFYLTDLSAKFHALWTLSKEKPELKFILKEQKAVTLSRLAMIRCVTIIIASGLDILGITPEEEM